MSSLLSIEEAQQRLLAAFSPLGVERIPLRQAVGRVLAESVAAEFDFPPFTNSSMDGFAVQAGDLAGATLDHPVKLRVIADIPAGRPVEVVVHSGEAARIMTGALLPPGSDAVIPVEDTDVRERQVGQPAPEYVQISRVLQPGDYVRPQGQDFCRGESVLSAGKCLQPQDIGFLSMLGIARVPVYRRPRLAVFSTGDELCPLEQPLLPGQIHDANSYMLMTAIEQAGGETVDLGIVLDRAEAVQACLDQAVEAGVDLIVSSAGVSVGAFDFVRQVVERHGQLEFWRVNIRPGKPVAFGRYRQVLFMGLPGNPVSAYVSFRVFVHPLLMHMAGRDPFERKTARVRLLEPVESDGRVSYLRALVALQNGVLSARLSGHQGSGNLHSLVQSNAFLIIPSGVKSLPSGAEVDAWLLDG